MNSLLSPLRSLNENFFINGANYALFALRPDSKLLDTQQRIMALALSIIMGILTIGLGHLVCKIICEVRKHQFNTFLEKHKTIFRNTVGGTKEEYQAVFKLDPVAMRNIESRLSLANHQEMRDMCLQQIRLIRATGCEIRNYAGVLGFCD